MSRPKGRRLTLLVAAFGDPGHAFPAAALASALAQRGHSVVVESWEKWRGVVEGEGLEFVAAEEYQVFPPPPPDHPDARVVADAARALVPTIREMGADAVVSDILTVAPALAAEVAGVPRVTLVPHIYPVHEPDMPFFSFGWMPPRSPLGRAGWRAAQPVLEAGLRRGRRELNESRAELGLPALDRFHGGISEELVLVGTFPQLEYPRRWPPQVRVTGPMEFELPHPDVELPGGEGPLVLVAPSTSQDPDCRLVRVALEALADEPVRVLATLNGHAPAERIDVPGNARVVEWVSYSQVMPEADLVICHGGHGTVARALGAGVPVLCCPAVGDMAETAIRVAWAGAGLSLPWRLTRPGPLQWAVARLMCDVSFHTQAESISRWSAANQGADTGAQIIEGSLGAALTHAP